MKKVKKMNKQERVGLAIKGVLTLRSAQVEIATFAKLQTAKDTTNPHALSNYPSYFLFAQAQ